MADNHFADWSALDPGNLPDSSAGPFLTTNNIKARNAHGMPSHVYLVQMFHKAPAPIGPVTAFNDGDRKIWGLTHYRPAFTPTPKDS